MEMDTGDGHWRGERSGETETDGRARSRLQQNARTMDAMQRRVLDREEYGETPGCEEMR